VVRAFLTRDWTQLTRYRYAMVWRLMSLVFYVLFFYFLAGVFPDKQVQLDGSSGRASFFLFAIIGYSLADLLRKNLSGTSSGIRHDQVVGTLETILGTGRPLLHILLASSIFPLLDSVVRLSLFLGIAAFVSSGFAGAALLNAILVLALSCLVFVSFGIAAASLLLIVKKGEPISTVFAGLSFLFGGTLYPISAIPEWLHWLSYLLPITYCIRGIRLALLDGAGLTVLAPDLLALAVFAAVGITLALVTSRGADKVLRKEGIRHY
jgi:ABC-2 type transport system permease protein